jgi:hypothetical protein
VRTSRGSTTDDIANVLVRGDALTAHEDSGWKEDVVRKLAALHVRRLSNRCAHPGRCPDPGHVKDTEDGLRVLEMLGLPADIPVLTDEERDVWGRDLGVPEV